MKPFLAFLLMGLLVLLAAFALALAAYFLPLPRDGEFVPDFDTDDGQPIEHCSLK